MQSFEKSTLTIIAILGLCLCSPALADVGTPGETFARPSTGFEVKVVRYPEADVQRYVITKSKGFAPSVQVEYPDEEGEESGLPGGLAVNGALAAEILSLTNQVRSRHGLRPVTVDQLLTAAAEGHSTEMTALDYFSHTSPTPGLTTPSDRVYLAGAHPSRISENLFQAEGFPTDTLAQVVVDSWLGSSGHRANLLDPDVTHVGLGVVEKDGKVSVTQVFGGGL